MFPDNCIIQILGPVNHCRVHSAARVGGKLGAMLATLVLWANRAVSPERLTAVLWGEVPPRSATANLRTYAHALRDRLAGGPAALESQGGGYLLRVDADHCDYLRFEQLVQRGRTAFAGSAARHAVETLEQALQLWAGEQAAQGTTRLGPLDGWLAALEEERRRTVESLAEARIELGEARLAARELSILLADSPLRGRAWRLKMKAHHALGEHDLVAASYQTASSMFRRELGIDPDPRLTELYRSLRLWHGTGAGVRG